MSDKQKTFIINTMSESSYVVLSSIPGKIRNDQLNIIDDQLSSGRTVIPSYDLLEEKLNEIINKMNGFPEGTRTATPDEPMTAKDVDEMNQKYRSVARTNLLGITMPATNTSTSAVSYYTIALSGEDDHVWEATERETAAFVPTDHVCAWTDGTANAAEGLSDNLYVPSKLLFDKEMAAVRFDGLSNLSALYVDDLSAINFYNRQTSALITSCDATKFIVDRFLSSAYYDKTTGELVLVVKNADGSASKVRIPFVVDNKLSLTSVNPVQNKIVTAALATKTDRLIITDACSAEIFNEDDGSGAKFSANDVTSYVGVNDPHQTGAISGIAGQLYVISGGRKTKLNMYDGRFCYVKGDNPTTEEQKISSEIAVKGELSAVSSDLKEGISELSVEIKGDISNLSTDLLEKISAVSSDLKEDISYLSTEIKNEKERAENVESELQTNIGKKVDIEKPGEHGVGKIFNEGDGGGAMFVANDGISSYVGVNDGNGEASGIMGQLYVVNGRRKTKLNMYDGRFCYVKDDNPTTEEQKAACELVTLSDTLSAYSAVRDEVAAISAGLDSRISAIEEDYLTSEDKSELEGKISKKVAEYSDNGKSRIFNEDDGGGVKFTAGSGVKSYVGVNDPDQTGRFAGLAGQLYVVSGDMQTKLNMYDGRFCYVKGHRDEIVNDAASCEIAVCADVSAAAESVRTECKEMYGSLSADVKELSGKNFVLYTNVGDGRKAIVLDNEELITGKHRDGSTDTNLIRISEYDIVDVGSQTTTLNLNTKTLETSIGSVAAINVNGGSDFVMTNGVMSAAISSDGTIGVSFVKKELIPGVEPVPGISANVVILSTAAEQNAKTYAKSITNAVSTALSVDYTELVSSARADLSSYTDDKTAKLVKKEITGTYGVGKIFNEGGGGGAMFVANDGISSYVGVNDGNGEASGIMGQLYVVGSSRTKLNMYDGRFCYVKDDNPTTEEQKAACELVTKSDVVGEIAKLSVGNDLTGTAGQTVTKITETSGVVSAEFGEISIGHTQVSDWTDEMSSRDKEIYRTIYSQISAVTSPSVPVETAICAIYMLANALSGKSR